MDKRSLECFIALAEELHFHRAARRCHISQPALSQLLRRLEDHLQVQLLLRSKRQVSLTRSGTVFLDEARRIVRAIDTAVERTRQIDGGMVGHLSVGATASALFIVMPEIAERFRAALPQVDLRLHHMTTAEQETSLRNHDIHVGICHPPVADSGLHCDLLAELPFYVVLSQSNPLAERPSLALRDLAEQSFILFPRDVGPRLYDHIIALCQRAGFSPHRIIEASPAQSIVAMAAANMGVGFVASRVQHYDRPLAVFRKITGPAPSLTLGAAYVAAPPSPMLRTFLEIAADVGRTTD